MVDRLTNQYYGLCDKIQRKSEQRIRAQPSFNNNGNFRAPSQRWNDLNTEIGELEDNAYRLRERIRSLGGSV